jgi:hypothetical protein
MDIERVDNEMNPGEPTDTSHFPFPFFCELLECLIVFTQLLHNWDTMDFSARFASLS